jgi:hypothetical protein
MQDQGHRYFFSYSRDDSEFVLKLAEDMRKQGLNLWIDQLDIRSGERWDESVERALKTCSAFLVVLSPKSVASRNVMDEVSFAIDNGKEVLPILHRRCDVPFRISRLQHIDFTQDYDQALARLLKSANAPASDDLVARTPAKRGLLASLSANALKIGAVAAGLLAVAVAGLLVAGTNLFSSTCLARSGFPMGYWTAAVHLGSSEANYSNYILFLTPTSGTWSKGSFETSAALTAGKEIKLTASMPNASYESVNTLKVADDGCSMDGTFRDSQDHKGRVSYTWKGDKPPGTQ